MSSAVYQRDGRDVHYIPYKYDRMFDFEKIWSTKEIYEIMRDYWTYTIWMAISYVVAVHVMKKWMEDKKPLELRGLLILWNAALSIFSIIGTIRVSQEFWHVVSTRPLLDSVSLSSDPNGPFLFWLFLFAISKFFEFGDTAFLILRKKPVIFLHWYHHATVIVYTWHSGQEFVAAARWFMAMNFFIHSIMYGYYAISAMGIRLPKSISMLLTTMQITQMLIGLMMCFSVTYCKLSGRITQQSNANLLFCFTIYGSYAVLFTNFFRQSYLVKKDKVK